MENFLSKLSPADTSRRKVTVSIDMPFNGKHDMRLRVWDFILPGNRLNGNHVVTFHPFSIRVEMDEYALAHLVTNPELALSWGDSLTVLRRLAAWRENLSAYIAGDGGYQLDKDLNIVSYTPESEYGEGG